MPLHFPCAACGRRLKIDPQLTAGRVVHCPACHAPMRRKGSHHAPHDEPKSRPAPMSEAHHAEREDDSSHSVRAVAPSSSRLPPVSPPRPVSSPRPKKVARKLSEPLVIETPHWTIRHLHWLLLFALVPILASLIRGDLILDIEERVEQTLSQFPEGERHYYRQMDIEELLHVLPEHKLAGALFPRRTWGHWTFALLSGTGFLLFFFVLCSRGTAKAWHLVLVALFTATIGIFLLLMAQVYGFLTNSPFFSAGPAIVFLWVFKFIGTSYVAALDPHAGFLVSFAGFTLGVGLCEELCKVLPVLFYLKHNKSVNGHGAFLWGLASGAGFGISEGISYSSDLYNGIAGPAAYLERFISCVALHAIWSGCVAVTLYLCRNKLRNARRWWTRFAIVLLACAVPMILHGLYDTFLKKELAWGSFAVALISFAFLATVNHYLHAEEDHD